MKATNLIEELFDGDSELGLALVDEEEAEVRRGRALPSRVARPPARVTRARPPAARFPRPPKRPPPGRPRPSRPRVIGGRQIALEPPPCICPAHGTEFVRWVQSTLNQLFGLNLTVNGVMNHATREALRRFQQERGLQADGIAGPDTERALLDARGAGAGVADKGDVSAAPESPEELEWFELEDEELEAPMARPTLRLGSRGDPVRELQQRLAALGFSPGAADGIFGSRTEAAVKSFQGARRITADGIVGAQTWSHLYGAAPAPTPGTTSPRWVLPPDVQAAGDAQTVRYDSPPPWANGAHCTSYTAGAAELRRHILANFPGVDAIGGYSCRANSGNPSETSVHGVGRALDIMIRPVGGGANSAVGDPIANWLVRNAEAIGVQYIIWNRMRWSGNRRPRVAPYTGPSPHIDHIHVELNLDGARRNTAWFNR